MMSDQTAAALQALIQQVTTLTEKIEETDKKYDAVYKMNANLLNKVKGPKDDDNADPKNLTPADWEALNKKIADRMKPDTTSQFRKEGEPVQITRSDALDVTKYKQAQEVAAKAGVNLEIVDDRDGKEGDDELPAHSVYKEVDTSAIDMVQDDAQKVRYVRQDIAYGGSGFVANSMAAEREGFRFRTYKDKDDLPEHMQTKLELMARAAVADGAGGQDADE